jgi:hypothetical protein
MVLGLCLVICLVGLLIYVMSNNPANGKLAEIGRIMFAFGLLALLLNGDKVVAIFGQH